MNLHSPLANERTKRKAVSLWVIAPVASVLIAISTFAFSAVSEKRCTAQLRSRYFEDDFDRALRDNCIRTARSTAASAWYILNKARAKESGALRDATDLMRSHPNDPFANLAMAGALLFDADRPVQALHYARLAAAQRPNDEAFQWIYADSLRVRGRFADAERFIRANRRTPASPLLLSELGDVRFESAERSGFRPESIRNALAPIDQAARTDPSFARPYYIAGQFLQNANRPEAARAYLAKAADLTWSDKIRATYWDSVRQSADLSRARKVQIVLDDVRRYERSRTATEFTYQAAALFFQALGLRREYGHFVDKLMTDFPGTPVGAQEKLLRVLPRVQQASIFEAPDPKLRKSVIDELRSITSNRRLDGTRTMQTARENLLKLLIETPSENRPLIREVADQLAGRSNGDPRSQATAAIAIATIDPKDVRAAEIAAKGLLALDAYVRSQHIEARIAPLFKSAVGSELAYAQGFANSRNGRPETARANLRQALRFDPYYGKAMALLGELDEAQRNFSGAEDWYVKCAALPFDPKLPCVNSLSRMYRARYGTEDGLDTYLAQIKPRILAATSRRIEQVSPSPVRKPLPFDLTMLDGRRFSSASTRGKVVVLIFWGIWCDACRIDLPEIFTYAQQFKGAGDVIFLTVNDGRDLLRSKEWLVGQNAPPTAVNGAFSKAAGVAAVPTTVFVDRRGREAFRLMGLTGSMLTEFGKRLSVLRNEPAL